jgi:uncharacterized Zn-finger protein
MDIAPDNRDMAAVVGDNVERYLCEECGQTFAYSLGLMRHQKEIHDDEIFSCELCPFTSKWKNNLISHNRVIHRRAYSTPGKETGMVEKGKIPERYV